MLLLQSRTKEHKYRLEIFKILKDHRY